ncbi:MAG: hypothetical protein UR27_C0021G0012 [Candidatus Peregrinibacteria bacterium GW2011_GWA2_33_10]|nr:MAG: hypothetical protein UR27_C0021G0012 [Candidatus Peregrinibacteria bacterium GW2011_GWA2_33_10]KKP41004.1 MAG: hypothetical protein UR30_C0002G0038 [Candidatus Peregrinibacteria bacterium GW2011_GWC2_33_13]OGJ49655.1 MAG: hypothetical protein A2229_03765 [Candidatus Peregrinibacteria bacterium RIFOXYA2_FULL_33_7]
MKQKLIYGSVGFLSALILTLTATSYAQNSEGNTKNSPFCNNEKHQEVIKAIENNDYQTWKKLMEENGMHPEKLDVINEENFAKFSQMHKLMREGKFEEANKIREELGLKMGGRGMMGGKGFMKMHRNFEKNQTPQESGNDA